LVTKEIAESKQIITQLTPQINKQNTQVAPQANPAPAGHAIDFYNDVSIQSGPS
jgi:uncharacterized caspase-like protein